jgi:peptide/nickel transport system ATP-binding protein
VKNILQIENLSISFRTDEGTFNMIKDLSYSVGEGEIVGIVGESGCGKTISSLCTMGLLPSNAIVENGHVILNEEEDLLTYNDNKMSHIRGKKVSMIFQEPMKALDPVFTIGNQMEETVRRHNKGVKKAEARARCLEMLKKVEIANPEHVLKCYPHELSGGMKQRIIIAMALICEPMLLIADEPTTALDVTIQAQILELMQNIRKITNASIIFITHDLGVIANLCDRVLVMYAGQVVEAADKKTLFLSPKHPYTRGLLGSLPRLDEDRETLDSIPGSIPLPKDFPAGCRFSTRCEHASEQCAASEPGCYMCGGSLVKCWRYAENKTEKENEQ